MPFDWPGGVGITEHIDTSEGKPLKHHVKQAIERYFRELNGAQPASVYDMVLREVERPLLEVVMQQTNGNQSRAAEVLGINRNTLRKKLKFYQLIR